MNICEKIKKHVPFQNGVCFRTLKQSDEKNKNSTFLKLWHEACMGHFCWSVYWSVEKSVENFLPELIVHQCLFLTIKIEIIDFLLYLWSLDNSKYNRKSMKSILIENSKERI